MNCGTLRGLLRLASSIYNSTICQSSKIWQENMYNQELGFIVINEEGAKGNQDFEQFPLKHLLMQYLCQRTHEMFGKKLSYTSHGIVEIKEMC